MRTLSSPASVNVQGESLSEVMQLHFLFMESTTSATQISIASGRNGNQTHRFLGKLLKLCFLQQKKYSCLSRKPTQSDRSALYRDLQQYGKCTGLCWLMSPEPVTVSRLPIPTIDDIIFSQYFLQTREYQEQIDCFIQQAKIPEEHISRISDITVGQRDNPSWHLARKGRLTASNFGCIFKAKQVTQSLLKRLRAEYDLSKVKAVQWGVKVHMK